MPGFYRVMRASTQDVRGETYVEASRAIGCTTWRTLLRHVLPNAIGPLVVQIALGASLLLDGRESPDGLHYLYGLLPILVTLLAEGARAVATEHEMEGLDFESLPKERQRAVAVAITRRETGIMAVSALVIFGLALRAYFTSPLG